MEHHILKIPVKPGMRGQVEQRLKAHELRREELDAAHAARQVEEVVMFLDGDGTNDVLFIYRRGLNLEKAGAKFLLDPSAPDKDFTRLLLEATNFEEALVLPVGFRWPALEG